jgi:UDP-N-acetylglucosamine diphosphorylase / glucose-1-phosphate thymidylyltransferase / UDP-N-acetylgalactosamine diphosphorylase / glucosamine-1-phosphate N-acetyltransferase / galactosamine-1-phosphate N-acetyltransferase
MRTSAWITCFDHYFPDYADHLPWFFISNIERIVTHKLQELDDNYRITNGVAIHRSAIVEEHVIIKSPGIIGAGCFVGAHAYLRGGFFLGEKVVIGPGCEIKSTAVMDNSALAHFNFAGDSLIGSDVNIEAGGILANYHNDRDDKTIYVFVNNEIVNTGVNKFGTLAGDSSKIGANSVCNPGTILPPGTRVPRLTLVNQIPVK